MRFNPIEKNVQILQDNGGIDVLVKNMRLGLGELTYVRVAVDSNYGVVWNRTSYDDLLQQWYFRDR